MRTACHNILYTQANSSAVRVEADATPYWYLLVGLLNGLVLGALILLILKRTAFKEKKLRWLGVLIMVAVVVLALLLTWFCAVKPAMSGRNKPTEEQPASSEVTTTEATPPATEPAPSGEISPENGMELYDLADFWLGCHVYVNAEGSYRITYDYGGENNGIESDTGTWERVSETEIVLKSNSGVEIPVILAEGKWACELTEPNTGTVCHPSVEVGAAPAAEVKPENGMELYELADYWLGCHVNINTDGTYTVAYDYNEENSGIVSDSGTWERVSDTELVLKSASGAEIPVTLADGKWSYEVTEPNTGTVCHPFIEAGGGSGTEPESPASTTYTVIYTDAEGNVYASVETTDNSAVPEVETPVKEGYLFAGWQSKPVVTKDDLILGVSPYEIPTGASSLYGGAGTALAELDSMGETMYLLYARWVEATEIHNAAELKTMGKPCFTSPTAKWPTQTRSTPPTSTQSSPSTAPPSRPPSCRMRSSSSWTNKTYLTTKMRASALIFVVRYDVFPGIPAGSAPHIS